MINNQNYYIINIMECAICEGTDNVIQPLCCREKNSVCRDCIELVDFCPFCRCPKEKKEKNCLRALQNLEAHRRCMLTNFSRHRFSIDPDFSYIDNILRENLFYLEN